MTPALYPSLPANGTNYFVVDPGEAKNYFLKWYRVADRPDWTFVYREWPPLSTHGPWAEMAKAIATAETRSRLDGYPGPAQRYEYGRSIASYKRLILEAEGWSYDPQTGQWDGSQAEEIYERYMDSRMGGSQVPTASDEGTSLIDLFRQEQRDDQGRVLGPPMHFRPTNVKGGRSVAFLQSLELLNNKFDYDTDAPVTVNNCPRWYVADACEQSILAYAEYTGADGEKGALKDIIDPDWYFVNADCRYIPPGPVQTGGTFGY